MTFPIAFFIGALLFDLIALMGGYSLLHITAFYLSIAGCAGALVAAIPGIIDYLKVVPPDSSAKKRAGIHGSLNVIVLVLFVISIALRMDVVFTMNVLLLEIVAVAALLVSGWLGSTLVHRNQIGVDHRYARAGKWKEEKFSDKIFPLLVATEEELMTNQMKLLHIGKRRIVLGRDDEGYVAFDDRCPHRGGSLADGVMMCGMVHCPWHGSQFAVKSGDCQAGPAENGLQIYPVKCENGKVFIEKI